MADTVKTRVMKALETVLRSGVPEVKTVYRGAPLGTDLDKVNKPALYFFDEDENGRKANLLRIAIIRLMIVVFIRLKPGSKDGGRQAFEDLADTIAGRVYMVLQTTPDLRGLVIQAEEDPGSRRKAIGNESTGELVLRYSITYGHAAGDAFTTQV
jgi:hypothetical protein